MIQSTKADIICPPIATDNPDAFLHEHICQAEQMLDTPALLLLSILVLGQGGCFMQAVLELMLEPRNPFPLRPYSCFRRLISIQYIFYQMHPNDIATLREQFTGILKLFIQRDTHAQAKLGVIFKQGVGPRWSSLLTVHGPGSRRQVAAINGGTARRVGNQHAVAEQLGGELDIRRLTTPRTRSRKLEEWKE